MNKLTQQLLLFIAAFCTVIPSHSQDPADGKAPTAFANSLPQRWIYSSEFTQPFPTDDSWWSAFNDPLLDSLIAEGEAANFNLAAASRRIEMARQNLRTVRSSYYPQIAVNAGWNKERTSAVTMARGGQATTIDYFNAGATVSWEIDIFGRVAARARESKAHISASRADYAAVSVSICAEIATAYVQLRMLQEQLAVTKAHVAEQEKVMKIAEARFECSLASMLDVRQARTVYYSTKASLVALHTSINTTVNSLAVLTGCYPQQLAPRLASAAPLPQFSGNLGAGVPMDLLRRRPDVAEAEYTLAAYAAAIGIAKKEFLPTLSLNGSIATEAHRFDDLMTHRSLAYSVAPTLSWTVFDGFARRAAVASAKEQMLAGIDNYNLTLLTAVQEVENAMTSYTDANAYLEEIKLVEENARKAFELSLDRYKQGLDAFINVAQAQISLLQYSNELVAARANSLTAVITLYKALGGGWSSQQL